MSATHTFRRLPSTALTANTDLYRYDAIAVLPIALDAPASMVMTDLRQVRVVTVDRENTIDQALSVMVLAGVRLLIVIERRGRIVGLITSRDINGEKPVHFASQNRVRHEDIRVGDIMTPKERIEVLRMADVEKARVGDVIVTLQESARQHAVVVEPLQASGELLLRGLFSATQIGRRLGIEIEPSGQVQSFSELEAVLNPAAPTPGITG
jgi:CBS domain-containing protein